MREAVSSRRRWSWLVAGIALLLVSNGRWTIPAAVWLALPTWLVFVDRSPRWRGLGVAFLAWCGVFFLAWRGIVPAPGWIYVGITFTYALVYFIPILGYRIMTPRLHGIAATLVFPLAWVGIEFAFQRWVTPYGSWFSLAYTQTDLALLQVAAVGGTSAVSFVVTWCAASFAILLRRDSHWNTLVPSLALLAAVLVWGQVRLGRAPEDQMGVRTASIVPSATLSGDLDQAMASLRLDEVVEGELLADVVDRADVLNEDLLRRTRREARAGARIVAWSETAGRVLADDEQKLLERGSAIAAEEGVTLLLAYGVWTPGGEPPLRNVVAAIGEDGSIAWDYEKAHPIVGPETPIMDAGSGQMRSIRTPSGKVGAVICHDLDFPDLLRQAVREDVGLVVGPSADWTLITGIHARMAHVRAIESGFSLLRPTSGGRTLAVDPWGRPRASVDHPEDAVVAHVPVGRIRTVYGAFGDWFGWMALAGLAGLLLTARPRRPQVRYPGEGGHAGPNRGDGSGA